MLLAELGCGTGGESAVAAAALQPCLAIGCCWLAGRPRRRPLFANPFPEAPPGASGDAVTYPTDPLVSRDKGRFRTRSAVR